MAKVTLENLQKDYDDVTAVQELNLEIHDGEFITLLGPSGCGKTTSLRMIAGFIEPTAGRIRLGTQLVSDPAAGIFIPPEDRNIGMVFQSYAVWPHMTVFDNVAYPLKIARRSRHELQQAVRRALEQVNMSDLAERYPHQLSGGQQQRVALARALVMNPQVMLLDEPLSNLDAKLREHMRLELKELQAATNLTIIFVTHDQLEAIVLADRIVVMSEGKVEQVGTPEDVYRHPATRFVADFIGVANFLHCRRQDGNLVLVSDNQTVLPLRAPASVGSEVLVVARPEEISVLSKMGEGVPATIRRRLFLGEAIEYIVAFGSETLRVKTGNEVALEPGQTVGLQFDNVTFFTA